VSISQWEGFFMKRFTAWRIVLVILTALSFGACSKPKLYGTTQEAKEVVRYYPVPPQDAYRAAKEALVFRGDSLKQSDDQTMTLETYWQPTTADSHYVDVFGREDYGTVGAYYRLAVKITPKGTGSRVGITNVAKSFISDLKSSEREED